MPSYMIVKQQRQRYPKSIYSSRGTVRKTETTLGDSEKQIEGRELMTLWEGEKEKRKHLTAVS